MIDERIGKAVGMDRKLMRLVRITMAHSSSLKDVFDIDTRGVNDATALLLLVSCLKCAFTFLHKSYLCFH